MTTYYYTASSVDGFIADADNSLSWLLSRDVDHEKDMGFETFRPLVGACAMGATTWQWILDNDPGEWSAKPTWVFTHRDFQPTEHVTFTQGDVTAVHREMVEAAGGLGVWIVGGGELVGQFADAGLLDEVWVQWAPVTLGSGAPLLPRRLELKLEEVVRNRELVCGRYTLVR
ncbi:dihydrofolate reductase family protein [Nocardioides sp. LHG3406-4]|uniref:dihydrofolate reductase family protein n=1 Tax=Nocardioides sp. LHG3406-4 TaxID=2804575 RepID=UPI003CED9BD5